jgi:uncharacterized surface protein with fasciclin (FAS1) repeats
MKDFATNFMEGITGAGELTLLAPSNEAFRRLGDKNLNALLANQQKLTEILQLHVIRRRLSSDEIIQNPLFSHVIAFILGRLLFYHLFRIHWPDGPEGSNRDAHSSFSFLVLKVESADRHRRLYFSAFGPDDNITISVEGGGVNATIIQPDIGALNGIVHIIDRVLGVPTMTVIEKLQQDPIMRLKIQLKFGMKQSTDLTIFYAAKHTRWPSKMISSGGCKPTEIRTTLKSSKSSRCWCPVTRPGRLSIARWARLSRSSLWENILTT